MTDLIMQINFQKNLIWDYKTIRHHIKILVDNNIIKPAGDSYSKLYFLSDDMENNCEDFPRISGINL